MPRNLWKTFLTYGSKALILGVLLVTVFSPFGQIFQTPVAQAASCPANTKSEFQVLGNDGSILYYNCLDENATILGRYFPFDNTYRPGSGDTLCNSITSCLASVVYLFTVGLGSLIAYAAAWMFSIAVVLSLQSTAYALTFLSTTWEVVRDIANMFFILILVYIAITLMFRAETADTMKRLAWVVVMALLINFSFFFTRVVIDAGNLLAVQFYNAIDAGDVTSIGESAQNTPLEGTVTDTSPFTGQGAGTKDLTASIMNGIGIYTLLNNESFKKFQEGNNWGLVGSFQELILLSFVYIVVGVMFFMLAAAFFALAVKFLIRMVILWVVLFTSPLAFVANTLQQGKKGFQIWWNALVTQTFYPAVFLFLFYIVTLFVKELRNGGTILGQAFGQISDYQELAGFNFIAASVATLAIYLGLVLIFLYIAVKGADKMELFGKEAANGFARWATGVGSNIGYGFPAWVGRKTMGNAAQERYASMSKADRGSLWGRTLNRVRQSSLDLRDLPGGKGVRTALRDTDYGLGAVNYELGEARKLTKDQKKAPPLPDEEKVKDKQQKEAGTKNTDKKVLEGEFMPPERGTSTSAPRRGPTIEGETVIHAGQPKEEPGYMHSSMPRSNLPVPMEVMHSSDISKILKEMKVETKEASKAQREAATKLKEAGENLKHSGKTANERLQAAVDALNERQEIKGTMPKITTPQPVPVGGEENPPLNKEGWKEMRKNAQDI